MNKTNQNKIRDKIYYISQHLNSVLDVLNNNRELENGILITQFEKIELLLEDIKYYFNDNYYREFQINSELLDKSQKESFHIPCKSLPNLDQWENAKTKHEINCVKIICVGCQKSISELDTIMMTHNYNLNLHVGICQKCSKKYKKLLKNIENE